MMAPARIAHPPQPHAHAHAHDRDGVDDAKTERVLMRYAQRATPRYTSYPPANLWSAKDDAFAAGVFAQATRPVSLYVHVPFCRSLCLYCGCNMLVTEDEKLVERMLAAVDIEIERVAAIAKHAGPVVQLHLGGGTPTFLSPDQLARLITALRTRFHFGDDVEASIEIHPAVTSIAHIDRLAELSFKRLSMGIQDFDPDVQKRVRRIQTFDETKALIDHARARGFDSINVDLMYGLPLQTVDTFAHTLDRVVELRPDRIALFGYAHVPQVKKHQRLFVIDELPTFAERVRLLTMSTRHLVDAGYVHVGLDHFALPTDSLVRARETRTLRRNFMGYTTCADSDVLAFGPSAISDVRGAYVQKERDVRAWASRIEEGGLAVVRGHAPSADEDMRRRIIEELFCALETHITEDVAQSAAPALARLVDDGLVDLRGLDVRVTPLGQLLLREVASAFDATLHEKSAHAASV